MHKTCFLHAFYMYIYIILYIPCFCRILIVVLPHGSVLSTSSCELEAAEKLAAEVRNDLQTLNGRANFSIGYRFARITAACYHCFGGDAEFPNVPAIWWSSKIFAWAGTHAFGSKNSKMRTWREYEIWRNLISIYDAWFYCCLQTFIIKAAGGSSE